MKNTGGGGKKENGVMGGAFHIVELERYLVAACKEWCDKYDATDASDALLETDCRNHLKTRGFSWALRDVP